MAEPVGDGRGVIFTVRTTGRPVAPATDTVTVTPRRPAARRSLMNAADSRTRTVIVPPTDTVNGAEPTPTARLTCCTRKPRDRQKRRPFQETARYYRPGV